MILSARFDTSRISRLEVELEKALHQLLPRAARVAIMIRDVIICAVGSLASSHGGRYREVGNSIPKQEHCKLTKLMLDEV